MNEFLAVAKRVSARLERLAETERQVEVIMVDGCVSDHSSMPKDHWHPRWVAEQKLRAARRLVEALSP